MMKVKYYITIIIVVIASMTLFASCKQTPNKEIVISKNSETLTEKVVQGEIKEESVNALREQYDIPKEYSKVLTSKSKYIKCNIDAKVVAPNAEKLPTKRIQLREFTQNEVDNMITTLFSHKKIYNEPSIDGNYTLTKSEIESLIIETKEAIANEKHLETGLNKEELLERINMLEKEYNNAPNTYEEMTSQSDGKLRMNNLGQQTLFVLGDLGKKNKASLFIMNDLKELYVESLFLSGTENSFFSKSDNLTLSESDAVEIADNILKQIGLTQVESIFIYKNENKNTGSSPSTTIPIDYNAYLIRYSRIIENIPLYRFSKTSTLQGKDGELMPVWKDEYIEVSVDNNGIVGLLWNTPYEEKELINADTKILSFNEIMQRFEEMVFVVNNDEVFFDKIKPQEINIDIDEIALEIACIEEKDAFNTRIAIPVWNFYVKKNSNKAPYTPKELFLCINAVDGSIVKY